MHNIIKSEAKDIKSAFVIEPLAGNNNLNKDVSFIIMYIAIHIIPHIISFLFDF